MRLDHAGLRVVLVDVAVGGHVVGLGHPLRRPVGRRAAASGPLRGTAAGPSGGHGVAGPGRAGAGFALGEDAAAEVSGEARRVPALVKGPSIRAPLPRGDFACSPPLSLLCRSLDWA